MVLREFRDDPDIGNVDHQKVLGALARKRRDRGHFRVNAGRHRLRAGPVQGRIADVVAADHDDIKRIRVRVARGVCAVGADLTEKVDADRRRRGRRSTGDGVVRSGHEGNAAEQARRILKAGHPQGGLEAKPQILREPRNRDRPVGEAVVDARRIGKVSGEIHLGHSRY